MSESKKEKSKNTCIYCGNSPVPHFTYWIFQFSNILLSKWHNFIFYNGASTKLILWLKENNAGWYFIKLLHTLKFVSFIDDIHKCKTDRARVLWQEAYNRQIEMREILLFNRSIDTYAAWKKEFLNKPHTDFKSYVLNPTSKIVFEGLPRPKNYYSKALDEMDDKAVLKEKLFKNKLPVPRGGFAGNLKKALKIFNAINKPVIAKPRLGSRGRHVSIFIDSEEKLRKAFRVARQLCPWVIIEEQLAGPIYRATLINFELCGVLRGDPPQVVGDGRRNIRELIEIKNRQKPFGVSEVMIDNNLFTFLQKQNLKETSIPKKGEGINLSEKIGVNYGGSSSEDYNVCHGDNKDLFISAAAVVGDPIVGFDFIIPDITKSWKQQRCGFIEANSLPFINLHHNPLLGKPKNVAAKVWDMVGM